MAKMLKHFVLNNKILIGILVTCLLGVWYVIIEVNASDPSQLSSQEISEIHSKADVLERQADSVLAAGNTSLSIQLLDEAVNLTEQDSVFSKTTMQLLEKKGTLQERNKDKEGAIQSYLTVLEIGHNSPDLFEVRRKLGTIYSTNDYADGLIGLYKSVEQNPVYKREHANASIFLATAYLNKLMPDSTLYYIERAERNVKPTDSKNIAFIMVMRAFYDMDRGDLTNVVSYLDSAQVIQEQAKDSAGLCNNYLIHAMLDLSNNDFKGARDNVDKGLSWMRKNEFASYPNIIQAYYNLAQAYEGMGNMREANYYYTRNINLRDSIEMKSGGKTIAYHINNFQYLSKTNEARKLNEKQHLLQLSFDSKQRQQYLLLAILILIVVLFVYGFRLFWAKERQYKLNEDVLERDKQLLHKELEIARKKVEYDSQLISEKEELIAELEDKLTNSVFDEEEQQGLLRVIDGMKDGLKQERENIGMDILLNKDNARFYKKLTSKHPDITQTEARFCTLLYLNLDTKEIARILNISLDGVRKGRHRLRKKLEIGSGGDITRYLQGI